MSTTTTTTPKFSDVCPKVAHFSATKNGMKFAIELAPTGNATSFSETNGIKAKFIGLGGIVNAQKTLKETSATTGLEVTADTILCEAIRFRFDFDGVTTSNAKENKVTKTTGKVSAVSALVGEIKADSLDLQFEKNLSQIAINSAHTEALRKQNRDILLMAKNGESTHAKAVKDAEKAMKAADREVKTCVTMISQGKALKMTDAMLVPMNAKLAELEVAAATAKAEFERLNSIKA